MKIETNNFINVFFASWQLFLVLYGRYRDYVDETTKLEKKCAYNMLTINTNHE